MDENCPSSELLLSHSALIFLKAAETRNFSETGKFFNLTQSAVSRAMQSWEEKWGCPLFDRTSRPINLTAEGKIIKQELEKQLNSFINLASSIQKDNKLKPIVRIGCVESMSVDLLPKLIMQLKPKTRQIVSVIATSNSLLRQLREGQLDVIISSDSTAELSGLNRTQIFQEGSLLVLPRNLKNTECWKSWKGLQFCGVPFIKYHHRSGGGKLNDLFLRTSGIDLTNQIEVDSNSTMLSLISEGVGWTISRASTILQNRIFADKIFFTPMPTPVLIRKLYVLTRQNEPYSLSDEFISVACKILRQNILPELIEIAPWMSDDIFVLDPDSGLLLNHMGKRRTETR